jgi:hypothetical protein
MPQRRLDEVPVDPGLEPRGRPGVSEGVDAGPLVKAAVVQSSPKGVWHTGSGHGLGSRGHPRSSAAWSWEDPDRIPMGAPVLAKPLQDAVGKRDVAVLTPFAQADVDAHASRVNSVHLQMRPFLQVRTASIESGEADTAVRQPHAGEDGTYLRGAEDDREFLLPWRSDEGQGRPFARSGVGIEKLDAAQGDGTGAPGVVLNVLEIEEVITECYLRDAVGGLVVVLRELVDSPDIHLLGPCGQASELQVFNHPLAQLSHGDTSCT